MGRGRGADGGGNSREGGNSAVGGGVGAIVGGQQLGGGVGSSTSKNRSSHHNYKSPKQFELKES